MELKVQIPFPQLLAAVRTLTSSQKAKLKRELEQANQVQDDHAGFIEMLLKGPVYSDADIQLIEANREKIAAWRTKR